MLKLPVQSLNNILTRIISTVCVQPGVSQRLVMLIACCPVRQRLPGDHMGAPQSRPPMLGWSLAHI